MAAETTELRNSSKGTRRTRGPTKTFPLVAFEKVARFAKSIADYGISGEIQRLTLLGKLNMSSGSGTTRNLITGGKRYGLTAGNYNATSLSLTTEGASLFGSDTDDEAKARIAFDLSIARIEPFAAVYERIKEKRLPDDGVLRDEFVRTGLASDDAPRAAEIFVENLRYLGLVQEISGSEHVRDADAVVPRPPKQESDVAVESSVGGTTAGSPPLAAPKGQGVADLPKGPSVHIDIQIHIDSSAGAEQIEQVFASMAKHLYAK